MIKYAITALALTSVGLGGYSAYQTNKANVLGQNVTRLESEVEAYKKGAKLQAELREKNLELTKELESIRLEIENAEGADNLLPDDIRNIVGRLRNSNPE